MRIATVTTPLGESELLFYRMSGIEELGRLFQYELTLVSENNSIDFDEILGKPMTVHLQSVEAEMRHFNGLVARFSQGEPVGRLNSYNATLVPWPWFLGLTSDCRIFQNKSVPDIVKEIFQENGFSDFEDRLTGTYSPRTYCVQYRESDLNFISRLLEEVGAYYYFLHEESKHTLILSDSASAHETIPNYAQVPYYRPGDDVEHEAEHFDEWSTFREVRTGKYALRAFDFTKPRADLSASSSIPRSHERAEHEWYDYPGGYTEVSDGETEAKVHIEELQARHEQAQGAGNVRGLYPGGLFELTGFTRTDQNREYLVTSVRHELQAEEYEARPDATGAEVYTCAVTAMDSREPFRPARLTRKPVVEGPQTAIVVGPSGDEIHTDKYSRIKVQFHWDRYGASDENSSCWIRVAHLWAGTQWGFIHIPRIGQEVMIVFLEGDPDRPLVTGRVYNEDNMPPYELPGNATYSGIKSRSSLGGTPENFNEFRFVDTKGEEQVYLHAEKNQDIEVENDETHFVGRDRTKNVEHDETTTIGNDRTESVGRDESITISRNRMERVEKDETISIGNDRTETVDRDESMTINRNRKERVGKDEEVDIGENRSHSVGKDDKLMVGKRLLVQAGDEILLETGSASIDMKKNGNILVKGKDITIQGSGKITIKASGDIVMKGSKIKEN